MIRCLSVPSAKPSPYLLAAALATTLLVPVPGAAKPLTSKDLRKLGFAGTYRGTVSGQSVLYNKLAATFDPPTPISMSGSERIPLKSEIPVLSPTGASTFPLSIRAAVGNSRRVRVVGIYSEIAYDSYFQEVMTNTGSRVLKITKRGEGRRARFRMERTDRFLLNRQVGNVLWASSVTSGTLRK